MKIREKIREIREKIRGHKTCQKIRQIRQNTSNTWTPKSNTAKYEKYEDPNRRTQKADAKVRTPWEGPVFLLLGLVAPP